MEENKTKALEFALSQIEKAHGKGSIMKLGDSPINAIETISSGALSLDFALGIGGYPKGRIIEIYGPESSGKSTLSLHAVAEAQKKGGTCAYIDTEHALNSNYAENLVLRDGRALLVALRGGHEGRDRGLRGSLHVPEAGAIGIRPQPLRLEVPEQGGTHAEDEGKDDQSAHDWFRSRPRSGPGHRGAPPGGHRRR